MFGGDGVKLGAGKEQEEEYENIAEGLNISSELQFLLHIGNREPLIIAQWVPSTLPRYGCFLFQTISF